VDARASVLGLGELSGSAPAASATVALLRDLAGRFLDAADLLEAGTDQAVLQSNSIQAYRRLEQVERRVGEARQGIRGLRRGNGAANGQLRL
jgi:hypothetical protein